MDEFLKDRSISLFLGVRQLQNNRKPCLIIISYMGLARTWNTAPTVYSFVLTVISCPPPHHFTWLIWEENPPPFLLLCRRSFDGQIRLLNWVQTDRSSALICYRMDLWLHCGSHLIIIFSNNVTLTSPREREYVSLSLGQSLCLFSRSLGCLKLFAGFFLSILGHCSHGPASLPDYHENYLI